MRLERAEQIRGDAPEPPVITALSELADRHVGGSGDGEELARAEEARGHRERLAAIGELAAVVAHEIRNPLAVLRNTIRCLEAILPAGAPAPSAGDAKRLLSIAAEEADRLDRIVRDLLEFARPFHPSRAPTQVADLVSDVVTEVSGDPRLHFDLAPELPAVPMDRGYMRQALVNLVLNGLQAVPASGRVTVRARLEVHEERTRVRIDVADGGPGILPEVRESIFEPFFTTRASGTGLGLPIVKRIVDAHRGEIGVDSRPSGATFTIWLPLELE